MIGIDFLNSLAAELAWGDGSDGVNGAVARLFIIKNRGTPVWRHDIRDPSVQTFLSLVEPIMNNEIIDKLTNGGLYWGEKPYEGAERVAVVGTLNIWK